MGNTTDKIKKGIKATAGAVKRGAEKAKDAAVRVAYLTLADNVPRPLSNCPDGMNQPVISPRIRFFGASCHPVD